MKKSIQNLNILSAFVLFLVIVLFLGLIYPYHVVFQEQYQLFCFSTDYFINVISVSGGLADYFARFLTQFFLFPWTGAFIIAAVIVLIQQVFCKIIFSIVKISILGIILSYLPTVVFIVFLCDENAMFGFPVALLLSLLAAWVYVRIKRNNIKYCYVIIMIPVLFWMAGSVSVIFVFLSFLYQILKGKHQYPFFKWLVLAVVVVLYLSSVIFISQYLVHYPLSRIIYGINYYRNPDLMPVVKNIILVLFFLVPLFVVIYYRLFKIKKEIWAIIFFGILIFGGGIYEVAQRVNFAKEEVFAYGYMAWMHKWEKIIEKAEKNPPLSTQAMASVNLALAKTGQLGDKMFYFPQYHKCESLLPSYQRDMVTPMLAGEIYYHLGMVNTAHRFAFETMASTPDYQKSARCYKRIIEVNIINGNYIMAQKYLNVLKETLFYRKWAKQTEKLLFNDEAVNKHPEYGALRKKRIDKDSFFNNDEQDVMLAFLLKKNPRNRMAFEYLMAFKLLECDLRGFIKYYELGTDITYSSIPVHFQEALLADWASKHKTFSNMPWEINPQVIFKIKAFVSKYNSENDKNKLADKFGTTYWYYLLCQKK